MSQIKLLGFLITYFIFASQTFAGLLEKAPCAVCSIREGKYVDEEVADTTLYNDSIFYFCSADCKTEFLSDPASWSLPLVESQEGYATAIPS